MNFTKQQAGETAEQFARRAARENERRRNEEATRVARETAARAEERMKTVAPTDQMIAAQARDLMHRRAGLGIRMSITQAVDEVRRGMERSA